MQVQKWVLIKFLFILFATFDLASLWACDCDESETEKVIVLEKEGSDSVTYKLKFSSENVHINSTTASLCHPEGSKVKKLSFRMIQDFQGKPHGHGTTAPLLNLESKECTTVTKINFMPKHKMMGLWTATAETDTGKVTFDLNVYKNENGDQN